jgi:WD40 repeat protein
MVWCLVKATLFSVCFLFAFSCDFGHKGAAGKSSPEIRVYQQSGHSHIVTGAVFSADCRYIVSGSRDTTVKLWDVETGRELETFLGHTDSVESVAISADGDFVASASRDGTIRIWSTKTGKEFSRLEENADSVVFSPDGKFLFISSPSGVKFLDLKKRKITGVFPVENSIPASFGLDRRFITFNLRNIKLWNAETAMEIQSANNLISAISLGNDGRSIAAGTWNGTVFLWNTEGKKQPVKFPGHPQKINSVSFDSTSRYIVTASEDKRLIIWDTQDVCNYKDFTGHSGGVNSAVFSSDDRFIVSASSDATIKIWDVKSGELIKTLGGQPDPPLMSAISHDSDYIALLNRHNQLRLWNAKTGQIIDSFEIPDTVGSIAFNNDNSALIAVLPKGDVKLFNIKTGKQIRRISDSSEVPAVLRTFSSDGKSTVSVLWDGKIRIWNYETGKKKYFVQEEDGIVTAVALCPNNRYLAIGFIDGKITITDLIDNKVLPRMWNKSRIESLYFSPEGNLLVSGSRDGSIRLTDMQTGKETIPIMRHVSGISSVSIDDGGMFIVSSGHDNTTRLWDTETGKEIISFIGFADGEWIAITDDGYYNSSPCGDENLNVRIGDEIFGMDQFSAVFYQPEVVSARLKKEPDPEIVALNGELRMSMVPPSVQIKAPDESNSGSMEIEVLIKDRFHKIGNVQIVINGRLLGTEELRLRSGGEQFTVENTLLVPKEAVHELSFTMPVNLEPGSNRIQVIAVNDITSIKNRFKIPLSGVEGRALVYINNFSNEISRKPDLWILAIGSNGYSYGNSENNLKYSVNNAMGIKSVFENQQGKRYKVVHSRIIADGEEIEPTRINIINSISGYFNDARPDDVLVLFLSGHGEDGKNNEGQYYFLPQDVTFDSAGEPDYSRAISLNDIGILLNMPGRKVIFIDSCFSGGVDNKRLTKTLRNQSTVVFTSSQEGERSWEGSGVVGYGVFTESLISGIRGEATTNREIKILALSDYVYNKVTLLSGDKQHPYIYIPEGFYNFVLADAE